MVIDPFHFLGVSRFSDVAMYSETEYKRKGHPEVHFAMK